MDFYEELAGIIDAFNEAGIEYAVCGGVALAFHGLPRFTKDIDILVRKEDIERIRARIAPTGFDLPPADLPVGKATPNEREVVRISKIAGGEHLILDLLVVTPVFEPVWASRLVFEWRGSPLHIVSAEGLAIMKRLAGRSQDLVDLERLGFTEQQENPEDA